MRAQAPALLFPPWATHVLVRCWNCKHEVTLYPGDMPADMILGEFERRAKCSRCGTSWPHVHVLPRPKSRWGLPYKAPGTVGF